MADSRKTVTFPSADGTSSIRALVWWPEACDPAATGEKKAAQEARLRGIVQIVHGMVEHVERYDHFARYLTHCGFIVCAGDHIGHGKSVANESELGILPTNGKDIMIADVHSLRQHVQSLSPEGLPYGIFGHSMGSFVTRAYLGRHGEGVSAAVICGTGQQPRLVSKAGNAIARSAAKVKGHHYRSKTLDAIGVGAYAKAVPNARTAVDWISADPAVVDAYMADPLCGATFSVGGYAALTSLTDEIASPACVAGVPKTLPYLFVSGAEDPVGNNGKGVRAAAAQLQKAGVRTVEVKLYEGMRHEILNEQGKMLVYADVASWFETYLKGGQAHG